MRNGQNMSRWMIFPCLGNFSSWGFWEYSPICNELIWYIYNYIVIPPDMFNNPTDWESCWLRFMLWWIPTTWDGWPSVIKHGLLENSGWVRWFSKLNTFNYGRCSNISRWIFPWFCREDIGSRLRLYNKQFWLLPETSCGWLLFFNHIQCGFNHETMGNSGTSGKNVRCRQEKNHEIMDEHIWTWC